MKSLTASRHGLIIGLGGLFGGALARSLVPTWDIWLRAALTAYADVAVAVAGMLACAPRPPAP
ncbi:MAG: hypothetical protein ABI790_17610 [Betaproteobacteria bacterium]